MIQCTTYLFVTCQQYCFRSKDNIKRFNCHPRFGFTFLCEADFWYIKCTQTHNSCTLHSYTFTIETFNYTHASDTTCWTLLLHWLVQYVVLNMRYGHAYRMDDVLYNTVINPLQWTTRTRHLRSVAHESSTIFFNVVKHLFYAETTIMTS